MNNKIKKIILFGIIFVFLILIFKYVFKEEKKIEGDKKTKNEIKEVWVTPQGTATRINFYFSDEYKNLIVIKEGEDTSILDDSYKNVGSYKCTLKTCKYYGLNEDSKEIVIKDEGYLIYNFVLDKLKKLKLSNNEYSKISFLSYANKNYGLAIRDINGFYAFYCLDSEKFITDFKYTNVLSEQKNGLPYNRFIASVFSETDYDIETYYAINSKTGEELLKADNYIGIINNDKYLYYYVNHSNEEKIKASIYNSKYELLFNGEMFEQFGISNKGNLAINRIGEEYFSIYNKKGKLIKTSKIYKKIGVIMNDYIAVIDNDGYVKIVDYDGNVVTKFIKVDENYHFNTMLSSFDKQTGIYLIIENTSLEYGQEEKFLKLYYSFKTKEKQVIKVANIDV